MNTPVKTLGLTRNFNLSRMPFQFGKFLIGIVFCLSILACSPKVEVEIPDKPLTINLNVKIEHEIQVKVDQELEALF